MERFGLSEMVAQDHLTTSQKEGLETVIDAGSASSHRGYRPPKELTIAMLMTNGRPRAKSLHHWTDAQNRQGQHPAPPASSKTDAMTRGCGGMRKWYQCPWQDSEIN